MVTSLSRAVSFLGCLNDFDQLLGFIGIPEDCPQSIFILGICLFGGSDDILKLIGKFCVVQNGAEGAFILGSNRIGRLRYVHDISQGKLPEILIWNFISIFIKDWNAILI